MCVARGCVHLPMVHWSASEVVEGVGRMGEDGGGGGQGQGLSWRKHTLAAKAHPGSRPPSSSLPVHSTFLLKHSPAKELALV